MSPERQDVSFNAHEWLARIRQAYRLGLGAPTARDRDRTRNRDHPTPNEVRVFTDLPLAGRLRWLMLRRAAANGRVDSRDRARALAAKTRLFPPPTPDPPEERRIAGGASLCQWLSVGPRNINGRIKCLAIHPANGQILYAGAADGGVWKTQDGGQSWKPTMHGEDSLAIGALAVDPQQPNTVYAGTGEPVHIGPGGPTQYTWSYPGFGVYRTVNGGGTWAPFGDVQNQFIYRIAIDPFDSQNILCAGFSEVLQNGGLCRWDKVTGQWVLVKSGIFSDVVFDPVNQGVAYAGEYGGGVWKSTTGGQAWNPANTGLPTQDIGRVNLALARANPSVLYAKIEDGDWGGLLGFYRSSNAAGNWVAKIDPGVDEPPGGVGPQLWWCSYVAADPSDASGNIVYAGGIDVARSADGGQTWVTLSHTYQKNVPTWITQTIPTHSDHQDLVFDPANSARLYIATDGGVFTGTHTGGGPPVAWSKVSTGLTVTQFYDLSISRATPSMFGGGTQDNGTMVTTGSLSWRHLHGGDGSYLALHPQDPYTIWLQKWDVGKSLIRRSTDGATSALFPNADKGIGGTAEMPVTLLAMHPAHPEILYAGTNRIYRTVNGDAPDPATVTWTPVSPVLPNAGVASIPHVVTEITVGPGALVYAGTMLGRLYRASNFPRPANTFVDITPNGLPERWLSGITLDPRDRDTVYLTFLGYNHTGASDHVWRGEYNPATGQWTSLTMIGVGLPDVPVSALVVDPATKSNIYIATDIGVFRYNGVQWMPFDEGLPLVTVVDLTLDPRRRLLRAATHGRGMYQRRLAASCADVDLYVRDNVLDTGEVFPSPSGEWDPSRFRERAYHWQSADIKVDAPPFAPVDALVDGVEFDDPAHRRSPVTGYPTEDVDGIPHDNPIRGQVNRVYVQVHNRGPMPAKTVDVRLLWAEASAGLPPLPTDFWTQFATDTYTQTDWHLIRNVRITNVEAATPQVVPFDWTPPVLAAPHSCLLVMVDSQQDPLLPQTELDVGLLSASNKRVAYRNVHLVRTLLTGFKWIAWAPLKFHGGSGTRRRRYSLRIENVHRVKARVRFAMPRSFEPEDLQGFRVVPITPAEWIQEVFTAQLAGAIDQALADDLAALEPLVLEFRTRVFAAEAHGIQIGHAQPMQGLFMVESEPRLESAARFDVMQTYGGKLLGGSTYYLSAP